MTLLLITCGQQCNSRNLNCCLRNQRRFQDKKQSSKWLEFKTVVNFMSYVNIEIKAKCFHPEKVKAFLFAHDARFIGIDLQKDIYFNVTKGRLKLRHGNIENNLIFY